ncbi:hypothetical protein B0H17DRAFT_1190465 [Mycena rosella]|uniref:Uncharacterized protein n=1 Tax=Mycena rosella TaxID=1033263 RepID=A0AAD7H2M2_MYCRO|nr:hypothetical protein B0H17DRAFT_1190465 [Mycena rosella]
MTKSQAGHNNIGYRYVGNIIVDAHPPYLASQDIREPAKAQWVLTDLVNMAHFLEPHVSGDGNNGLSLAAIKFRFHLFLANTQKVLVIYKGVHYLKTRSGGSWDDDFGANVLTEMEAEVWEGIVLSRPECAPFRNKGWPPYPFFERLDPAKSKGDNSYRPRSGVQLMGNFGRYSPDRPDESQMGISQDQDDKISQLDLNTSSTQTSSSIPSTPSTPAPKKRRAASSTADKSSRKKAHLNPQDALLSVSRSLDAFGERMSTATRELTEVLRTTNTNSTPERRKTALNLAKKEKWLNVADQLRLGRLVGTGQTADEYMSWAREGSPERKSWVSDALGYDPDYYKTAPPP